MVEIERRREQARRSAKKRRDALKAAGIKVVRVRLISDEQKERKRLLAQARYAAKKAAGEHIPQWADNNKERHAELMRAWWEKNALKRREYQRAYRERHPEKTLANARKNVAKQRSTVWGRINSNVFRSLRNGIKNGYGPGKYGYHLGYSWQELRSHIEAQFTANMSWDNWGSVWELDHIVPLSSLKYESLGDPVFRQAWALSNIRPLPVTKNREKWANPDPQSQP